jgi:hypothetical protein
VGGSQRTFACTGPAERSARTSMSKTLTRRLDRLEARLLLEGPPRFWQIVYVSHEGRENGPMIQWKPGNTGNVPAERSFDWAS